MNPDVKDDDDDKQELSVYKNWDPICFLCLQIKAVRVLFVFVSVWNGEAREEKECEW